MIVQKATLNPLLQANVCEVRFPRRIQKSGLAPTRRMLCTNSIELLNSVNGRISLNYFAPKGPPKAYLGPDDLSVAWDVLMQDYRNINMYQMSSKQKFDFMNS